MDKEYNWKHIWFGALPVSLIMIFVFMSGFSRNTKFFLMVLGGILAAFVTYYKDKKKHNIFTAAFLVILISLVFYGVKSLGFI